MALQLGNKVEQTLYWIVYSSQVVHNLYILSESPSTTDPANDILKCATNNTHRWAMWKRRKLRLYPKSVGYWELVKETDESQPRVPAKHLNAMLQLLKTQIKHVNSGNESAIEVVFGINICDFRLMINTYIAQNKMNDRLSMAHPVCDLIFEYSIGGATVSAEYSINLWNNMSYSSVSSTMSVAIQKSFYEMTADKLQRFKSRNSHFIYFQSNNSKFLWHDDDEHKYKTFEFEENTNHEIHCQLEATYQSMFDYNFPLNAYNRETDDDDHYRSFNSAQIPALTAGLHSKFKSRTKPFVMRFTFADKNKTQIKAMEQLAINSYYDQFPRLLKREDI
eukprot:104889_1